jgi:hypothetical protein
LFFCSSRMTDAASLVISAFLSRYARAMLRRTRGNAGIPLDRIVSVLEQVGAGFVDESVWHINQSRPWIGDGQGQC